MCHLTSGRSRGPVQAGCGGWRACFYCSLLRCAELLSIESSDLQADSAHPSVMVLTATLRNRAGFIQAFPALELSLTSTQGETVARRVLTPKDYAPQSTRSEPGFAAGSELQIRVYIEAAALKPIGYRLYLFYS